VPEKREPRLAERLMGADPPSENVPAPGRSASPQPVRPMLAPVDGTLPVLEPAQVMRVWIAPWTDDRADLHWPGYVFTEVTPRRWSVGEVEVGKVPTLVPLQVLSGQWPAGAGQAEEGRGRP
jgi:conjugal transfer pilus assembly protein TraV